MDSPSPTTAGGRAARASPASPSPAGSPTGSQTAPRVKRNTACVHCRDSKVKCIAGRAPSQPCTRCAKLQLSCVFDRTHKRVSRRSKLEELQQEVRSIKEAVGKAADPVDANTRPLPLLHTRDGGGGGGGGRDPALETGPWPAQTTLPPQQTLPLPPQTLPPIRPSFDGALSTAPTSAPSSTAAGPTPATTLLSTAGGGAMPVQPRALKSRAFSGEDITYYFERQVYLSEAPSLSPPQPAADHPRYFEFFHPYFPIVREQSPDACYEAAPLLFWTIVLTAARRFARDATVLPFLTDTLPGVIWGTVAQQPLRVGAINALLLLCAWPLPTIRFFIDPSMTFASIALAASFQIGLHTGRGDISELLHPRLLSRISDEAATYTWAGFNIVSQRVASSIGFLPTGQFFNKTIEAVLDRSAPVAVPTSFLVLLDCARFSHRVCKTTTASLEERRGISHHTVELLEADFDQLEQCFPPDMTGIPLPLPHALTERRDEAHATDIDSFMVLSTRQEVQLFYFLPEPDPNPAIFMRNALRTYGTAQRLVRQAAHLQAAAGFLLYAPHYVFRTLVTAAVVLITVLLSPHMADHPLADKDALVHDALATLRACALHDGEMPARVASLFDAYWAAQRLRPPVPIPTADTSPFAHHLSTRFALSYVHRWKRDIEAARRAAVATAATATAAAPPLSSSSAATMPADGHANDAAAASGTAAAAAPLSSTYLPSMQADGIDLMDWDGFMDDFDWSFSPYMKPG